MAAARTSVPSSRRRRPPRPGSGSGARIGADGSLALRRPAQRRGPGGRIHWDRVGRRALLALLVAVFALFIGPASSWISTWHKSHAHRAQVQRLRTEHKQLVREVKALHDPGAITRRARQMGMVKPSERAYVVRGLPSG